MSLDEHFIIRPGTPAHAGLQQLTCRYKNLKGRPISHLIGSCAQRLWNQQPLT